MKYLRWVGLMSSLVIVGVLGGLMVPLPSEAATLKIDGVSVTLNTPIACDSGYNSCFVITLALNTPRTIGAWVVGDVSTTNRARVMINDLGTTGSVDKMKLTGVTFTPVVAAGDKTTTVIISHTFSNGQLSGDYLWGMGMAGQFDPPTTENVVGDEVILVGTGLFAFSTSGDAFYRHVSEPHNQQF